jgi:hypothetical protein
VGAVGFVLLDPGPSPGVFSRAFKTSERSRLYHVLRDVLARDSSLCIRKQVVLSSLAGGIKRGRRSIAETPTTGSREEDLKARKQTYNEA